MLAKIADLPYGFPDGLNAVPAFNGIKRNFLLFLGKNRDLTAENYAPAIHQANRQLCAPFGRLVTPTSLRS